MAHAPPPLRRLADEYRIEHRLGWLGRWVRSRFEVDTRALAAVRISLGVLILVDLLHRAQHLELFYTDAGVYPLDAYETTYTQFNDYAIHALSGELWVGQLLFLIAAVLAVMLALGYRTRLVGLLSLVLLLSLHGRNPAVLNGGDRLFRVFLFVALFTPIGERWSVDALRRGASRDRVATFGTAALLVQPIAVFTSNAALKHGGDTWYTGEALAIAMNNDVMTIALGNVVADYPTVLTALTYAWVVLLAGSPVFLLLTGGRLRTAAAVAYLGAFAGMALTMAVGLFPFLLGTTLLAYLSSPVWDAVESRVPARVEKRAKTVAGRGPLSKPSLERRALAAVRRRGHDSAASYAVAYAQSLLTILGALVLLWIVVFSADHATTFDAPADLEDSPFDEQKWGLYAPNPSSSYSWYAAEATLEDGSTVDAVEGGPVSEDRPPDASSEFETFRHRKFMQAVQGSGSDGVIAESYADWACENAAVDETATVESVEVVRFREEIPVDDEKPTRITVIERAC